MNNIQENAYYSIVFLQNIPFYPGFYRHYLEVLYKDITNQMKKSLENKGYKSY